LLDGTALVMAVLLPTALLKLKARLSGRTIFGTAGILIGYGTGPDLACNLGEKVGTLTESRSKMTELSTVPKSIVLHESSTPEDGSSTPDEGALSDGEVPQPSLLSGDD